jgi:glycosyltransferase involved in cell wall biosynthesis
MRLEDITPVILTCNEAPNLPRCLEKLSWAREVIVLDSFSTDGTADLTSAPGNVRFSQRKFDDHTSQWNHAVSLATTQWVLTLDADYILSDGFRDEVETLLPDEDTAAWSAEFRYCVIGRELRASLYPPRAVLFRRDLCHYVEDGHTQRLAVRGTTKRLSSVICHDDRKPLSAWVRAQGRYAELEARHLLGTPKENLNQVDRLRRWILPAPALVFLYTWLWKGLIFDGWRGWYYVMQRTIAELMLSLHLVHLKLQGVSTKA